MKLPRLGDPKTIRITERDIFGVKSVEEITTASQFDLLPTWAQYIVILWLPSIALGLLIYVVYK